MNPSPTDAEWLYDTLNNFRQSSIIIHSQGSVRGVAEDVRAFQQSIEDTKAAILAHIEEERVKAELYGRLHEIIEAFQKGVASAAYYSERHGMITDQLAALKARSTEERGDI